MRILFLFLISIIISCKSEGLITPKPHQYPRIDFPKKEYQLFDQSSCPLSFVYPSYSTIQNKDAFFDEDPLHPCWFDIYYEKFNGRLHSSYTSITSREQFDKLINDAFELASKHNIKTNYRGETVIDKDNVHGLLFEMDGPVASPLLFYLTDSIQHFFIASLYFENKVNPDSMQIVHDFIKADVIKTLESFNWK